MASMILIGAVAVAGTAFAARVGVKGFAFCLFLSFFLSFFLTFFLSLFPSLFVCLFVRSFVGWLCFVRFLLCLFGCSVFLLFVSFLFG